MPSYIQSIMRRHHPQPPPAGDRLPGIRRTGSRRIIYTLRKPTTLPTKLGKECGLASEFFAANKVHSIAENSNALSFFGKILARPAGVIGAVQIGLGVGH